MNGNTAQSEPTREETVRQRAAEIANGLRAVASLVEYYAAEPRWVRQVLSSHDLLGSHWLTRQLVLLEDAAACKVCGTGGAPGPREMAGQRRRLPADNRVRVLTDPACETPAGWCDGTSPPVNV